ncbi:MAG: IS110 family transposase [Chloroflexi bacterium]|nr:MAG: IS110 family transposase [Chloroflexota bacterium]
MRTFIVGVDSAKASFTSATVWAEQVCYQGETVNTPSGCAHFASEMEQQAQRSGASVIHLIIEPTGGYEAHLVAEAYRRQWFVTLVNPLTVRHWAQGRGRRVKTDRADALVLAHFGLETHPAPQQPPDDAVAELDSLLRRQSDLEKLLHSERNRLAQAGLNPKRSPTIQPSIQRIIEALEQELVTIQHEIEQLIAHHATLSHQRQLLLSVPGIGAKIAPALLVALHRFCAKTSGQGTAKQFTALLGLDPAPYESGASVRKRTTISRQGNAPLRSKLFLGALGGVRGHNPLRTFYHSLLARGKPKKLALVAASRKILVWAWAVFTHDTPFDPSRFNLASSALPA